MFAPEVRCQALEKVAKWAGGRWKAESEEWQVASGRWQEARGCVKGATLSCLARRHCTVEILSFFCPGILVEHQEKLLKPPGRSEQMLKLGEWPSRMANTAA